eukprot:TRINITY_DN3931_c0_g1_i3.p3 TRINITY_DN3931_c0_g1~~TRINITY_DN3931_c0_g1_i3.p3  ORF type:complete len:118 (+),score=56.22 TRINITY_DN3931_c0_g1_i3:254-607(+)
MLHAEMELHSATQAPVESQGEEVQADGTTTVYSHSDGIVKMTKLTSLEERCTRLEKAIGEASEDGIGVDQMLLESTKVFAADLGEQLAAARAEEEERLRKEEAARIKAEKKKKKKKK